MNKPGSRFAREVSVLTALILLAFAADVAVTALSTSPLLSASIDVLPEYRAVAAGKEVYYRILLVNINGEERKDVVLSVSVASIGTGMREIFSQETVAISTTLSLSRPLHIPESTLPGTYELQLEVNSNGENAKAADTFQVAAPLQEAQAEQASADNLLIAGALIIIIAIFAVMLVIERRYMEKGGRKRSIEAKDLERIVVGEDHRHLVSHREYVRLKGTRRRRG
ncbi:MAG: hypothetical protein HYW25_04375 [Candidatus Aenigmarchaeota archaeon]|nr:hypothetical protein [Candidatus Aenigmarchaeota archaeon]